MKPRIFLSGVTAELGSARDLAVKVLRQLGYEPVDMRIFGTEAGDLCQVLRKKIDTCEGLIHLVGQAYGAEPPQPDPQLGRFSYTQFEYGYARKRNITTWIFFFQDGYPRDAEVGQLDLPHLPHDPVHRDCPNHGDCLAHQLERRDRQRTWWGKLRTQGHVYHDITTPEGFEAKLAFLDPGVGRWKQCVLFLLVALILLGGATWASLLRQGERILDGQKAVEEPPPANIGKVRSEDDDIKRRLHDSIEEIYEREVKSAETQKGWNDKGDAGNAARTRRDYRRGLADAFADSLRASSRADGARPELAELRRVLKDSGDVEAIRFRDSQRARLLAEAERTDERSRQQKRLILTLLLEGVRLHEIRGEHEKAVRECEMLLAMDSDWPELLLVYTNVLIRHGDQIHNELRFPEGTELRLPNGNGGHLYIHGHGAFRLDRDTSQRIDHPVALDADQSADRLYEAAVVAANRLVAADPGNSEKRFALGEALLRRFYVIPLPKGRAEADRLLHDAYERFDALAKKHPADVRYATQLATTLDYRSIRLVNLGRIADGMSDLDRSLELRRWVATMCPTERDVFTGLIQTFDIAIVIQRKLGDATKTLDYAKRKLATAESAGRGSKSVVFAYQIDAMQKDVDYFESVATALGDWAQLLRKDAASLPRFLTIRAREFAIGGRLGEVAQAADKLRELAATTLVPNSEGATAPAGSAAVLTTRYAAARAYCDCAALVGQGKDKLDADELAARTKYLALSVACLQESVAAGFNDFEYLEADESFTPLRDRPEYKALFPRK